ncbi:dihydroneopterin aldolase [Pedomonas mirosovicensis]|uniref:dihydroneopterin aldolase n=1 Tax=Pedomonas mirosovicensis TaxID=2908641 RepID=UPI0021694341|nr:dihydroneopterin aldolase [Pedomonas mirosovicensis]MCH8684693.1 dihydroneopterin aldolase [Pedomonas mirosovicensis]
MENNLAALPGATPSPAVNAIRRVFVRDLLVQTEVGVLESEKGRVQPVRLNLDVITDATRPHDDQIENVLCYAELADGMRRILSNRHIHLVETIADEIAEFVLAYPQALAVTVRVEKLEAVAGTESVGVEITRTRIG